MGTFATVYVDNLGWIMALNQPEPVPEIIPVMHLTPEPVSDATPWFCDPAQIEAMTPEINWDRRVGDRIRSFRTWSTG